MSYDDLDELDPSLIPTFRKFPIAKFAEILNAGKAAVTKARYDSREACLREVHNVSGCLRYYQQWHPELAPEEFGTRTWQSAEDGRWRWAITPERTHEYRRRSA